MFSSWDEQTLMGAVRA